MSARKGGVRFAVIVAPRSSRSAVTGLRDGALTVALRAPPVDGAANAELVALLADLCGVPKRSVQVAHGASGRRKLVDVTDIDRATLATRIASVLGS